ncbi:hypothetical protein NML43_20450 [Rhodopseudomonas palustris]|uniref:hypothetical protein n=1 Tax=Rhodopseudomonas palustris TaxID=1076 RepID=UPI0020CF70B9|nr:hypothetical protein [Rhodopseudomonas palustris]MCP9629468.1 hypothetical protein [Rhodopseudomonas palustris]
MTEVASHSEGLAGAAQTEDRLDRAERNLPRRRFFSDMPDKGLFAIVAIMGFGLIVFLKTHDFNADFVAIGAVGVMVVYGIAAFQFRKVRMRPDRLGDNFYYLGFIFTLASLSAALLQLRSGTDIDEVLGAFGIALFTTIMGVAGRVLFVQMRGEIDEVEDEVRRDLLHTSADLRSQLSMMLAEFETFHTGVQQATKEAAANSSTVVQDAISNISRVTNAAAEKIDEAFVRERDNFDSFEQAAGRIERGLRGYAADMNDRMDELTQSVEKMVMQLSIAVDTISHVKPRKGLWPFRRK